MRQFGLAVLSWVLLWMVIDFDPGLRKGVAVLKTPGAILLAAAGLGFIYSLLLTWVNQTELLFTKSGITVSHGPLPYVRRKELTMNQVVEIIPGQGQRTSIEGINRIYFKLIAVLADQREVLLVRFQDEDVVIFTWRAVEAWPRPENQNDSSAARSMAK